MSIDGGPAAQPRVEMLWESDDPDVVIGQRFGFPDGAAAARWLAALLSELWGLEVTGCDRIVLSAHNALAWLTTTAGPRIVKWSVAPSQFARLAALAELTAWLAARGLPVSEPVPTVDGRRQVEVDGVSVGLQLVVDAELLDVTDLRQVEAAGAELARLHDALASYPEVSHLDLDVPDSLVGRVGGWLDSYPEHLPGIGREVLADLVAAADPEQLPTQVVHGDFRSANVLWSGSAVAAVLDFEETRRDQPVVELARSAVLMGTRFHDWGPVSAEVRGTLLAGYGSVRPVTPAERSWWEPLVLWHSLMMVPAGADPTGWRAAALAQL